MVAPMRQLAPAALLMLLLPFAAVASSNTCEAGRDTADDDEVLADAQDKASEWCGDLWVITSEEKERNREMLEDVGGADWLTDILNSANDTDALAEDLTAKYSDPNAVIADVGALGLAIALLVLHLLCCWNYLPCYKCCRRKKRVGAFTANSLKFCALVFALTFCFGTLIFMANIMTYATEFSDGISQMLCKSADLAVATLGGDGGTWPGLTGITGFLVSLNDKVEDGSDFMNELEQILLDSEEIDLAVTQTTATLRLMSDTLSLPANQYPKYTAGVEAYHECYTCTATPSVVDPVIEDIEDGAAGALQDARDEVETQLQGPEIADLRDMLCDSTDIVVNAKDSFRDMLKDFLKFDASGIDVVPNSAIAFAAIAFLVVLWACMSVSCCAVCDGGLCRACCDMEEIEQPRIVIGCNCCAWWCGCWMVIYMLVFGGILVAITVPFSSLCIVMDDLTGQQLDDWGNAFGLAEGESADMWSQATSVLETCFLDSGDGDLLANIAIDGVTLKDRLTTDLRAQIDAAFAELDNFPTETMADSQEYLDLKDALSEPVSKQTGVKADLASTLFADVNYVAMPAGLKSTGAQTSQDCDDSTDGLTGIQTFLDEAHTEFNTGPYTCHATNEPDLRCSFVVGSSAPCDATQNFLTLKYKLINDATYRCDVFEDDSGAACDVLNMGASPGYTNSCIRSDGTMLTKEVSCTWTQFVQYVTEFGQNNGRLDKVVDRLDAAIPAMRTKIDVELQTHLEDNLLSEIDDFVASTTCRFTQKAYNEFIEAMCYQALASMRRIALGYVGCAIFALFAAIEAWMVFRYMMDNAPVKESRVYPSN